MPHLRKQIRDRAKIELGNLKTTGANVFSGRISPLKSTEMPALLVFVFSDSGGPGAYVGGPTSEHQAVLKIEGVAQGNDELLDRLDQMGAEIEAAIFGSQSLLTLLMAEPDNPSTTIMLADVPAGGAARTGSIHMTFPIQFRTRQGDPTTQV